MGVIRPDERKGFVNSGGFIGSNLPQAVVGQFLRCCRVATGAQLWGYECNGDFSPAIIDVDNSGVNSTKCLFDSA
jgi:hypothetical protein